MKREKLEGLTECQTETLIALEVLWKLSHAFQTVDAVANTRLKRRFLKGGAKARASGYFAMYLTTTHKMLEELTRKGYADQSETPTKKKTRMEDKRPYKITKKGLEKVRKELGK